MGIQLGSKGQRNKGAMKKKTMVKGKKYKGAAGVG